MSRKKKLKKRERLPFWKKLDPELKHISEHIGKIIDNTNLQQVADVLLMGGLAYAGYDLTKDWRGALIGPIGLKLAQGYNVAGGAAGLVILGALGFVTVVKHIEQTVPVQVDPVTEAMSCPDGYLFTVLENGTYLCVISPSGLY